jgi:succinoglycan biosynthesis transport protein ExoP
MTPDAMTRPAHLPIESVIDREVPVDRRRPHSTGAARDADENYRKAALFLSKMVRDGRRSLLFCSARRREGTTTAVLSLAHHLQDSYGLRPLVIELNRRRPALRKLFRLDPAHTLDDALDRFKPASHCIQKTASGLSVIAGGCDREANPYARLAPGLKRVLSEVEEAFDVVLVDAPPILTQADAIIAATVVPRLILVVEAGRTNYEVLERVKRELATEDITIAGTVLVKHRRFIPRWLYWWFTR